jgi:hypothetical protein
MERKAFVIIIGGNSPDGRDGLLRFLDTRPEITWWYACLPFSVFVISTINASQISDLLRTQYPQDGAMFFVAPVSVGEVYGWLPADAWSMLRNPDEKTRVFKR